MPDEVMRMQRENMIAFLPNIEEDTTRPVLVRRLPYYGNPKLNGLWDDPRQG
jgi:hypothetical protein